MKPAKLWTLLFIVFGSVNAYSFDSLQIIVEDNKAALYSSGTNENVLVFLHGGINNPALWDIRDLNTTEPMTIEFLTENNPNFIDTALVNGYDVLIPLANDSMNWLNNTDYCHRILDSMISVSKDYKKRIITGFSDGGTGSYKLFYSYPDSYDGLVVFNGYPQHGNFYKRVNYELIRNKNVIFCSTDKDKVIPYEFLLTEYSKQKMYNGTTYLYVTKGKHSFSSYEGPDILEVFMLLAIQTDSASSSPYHGYELQGRKIEWYPFRAKIFRRYSYGKSYLEENRRQKDIGK